jgi:hypothetical protein
MNSLIRANNHSDYVIPKFEIVSWKPTRVEIGTLAGAVTTARLERGMRPLRVSENPAWTQVLGLELDGVPVTRARITDNGTVMIRAPGDGRFEIGATLTYGRGGASGYLNMALDRLNSAYLNLPLVDVGMIGLEGVAVLPDPGGIGTYLGGSQYFPGSGQISAGFMAPVPVPVPAPFFLVFSGLIFLGLIRFAGRRIRASARHGTEAV